MKLLRLKTPDLVLLDVNMPMVDGIKTLQHIKDTTPNIPVVMLSAVNNSAMVARCKELGCSDYLPKPFRMEEIKGITAKLAEACGPLILWNDAGGPSIVVYPAEPS